MKNIYVIFLFLILFACQEDSAESGKLPTVVTASVDGILNTSARIGGRVTNDGGSAITEYGVYWGTSASPDTTGSKFAIGSGTGVFYDTLRNLNPGIKYYVKAYATNGLGTAFGSETQFTTQINLPTVVTLPITDVMPNSVKLNGDITDDGGFTITERGFYWGTNSNLLSRGTKIDCGSGKGAFNAPLTNLERAVTYYAMAFATNIKGTVYGEIITFTTEPELPVVTTTDAVNINTHSAYLGGQINSSGGSTITEQGIYWSTAPQPATTGTKLLIESTTNSFMDSILSLTPKTVYYFVAYAINSMGTALGTEKTFTTIGDLPQALTLNAYQIGNSTASLMGIVSAKYLNTTVTFEYGTTASYGSSAPAQNGIITLDNDTVYASINGLTPNTTYHFRVKAENELGITYAGDSIFSTVLDGITGSVSDADGNSYNTIGIGNQIWMTENLRTTTFNDGAAILLVENDSIWEQLSTAAYCWYENNPDFETDYGALYNWHTVNTGKLCPNGWRVPSEGDFKKLSDYLGGSSYAGGLLKTTGTAYWNAPNTGATNQFGFNARGAGLRDKDAVSDFRHINANWWSSTNFSTHTAAYFYLMYNHSNAFQNYINKNYGLSVRCVKN